ncbi:MAG: HNH endonuclease signature motif containing protein [Phototrophicaceae bacterium]
MSLSQAIRRKVHQRAGGCCEYCYLSAKEVAIPFHVDHFIPRKHDGTDDTDNLCLACFDCNMYKSHDLTGFDPNTGLITPLFNPRQHIWLEHFFIGSDMRIQGLSAQGRTTARVLRMNFDERVEDRRVLAELGVYPCLINSNTD